MTELHSANTESSIILWWEPIDAAAHTYAVLLNVVGTIRTNVTHATFNNLQPDTDYAVVLLCDNNTLANVTVRTGAIRTRITVTDAPYRAVGDGVALNTQALQQAIDACPEGGEVYVPAGIYLTGALRLHSHMRLHLAKDAVLQGTDRPADYLPKIHSRFEGIEQECYQSLLNLGTLDHASGPNCCDILIDGEGTICGGGQKLALAIIEDERVRLHDYLVALGDKIKECENDNTIPGRARGRLINISNCEDIRISGLTLKDGASWNVHMVYSSDIVTDHCVFRSEGVWNGDGWDPDSSEDCTLFACEFHTGDDSVAIKSGKNPEGNVIGRPTRHIRIFDCISHYGLGIAIGSEMSGGVDDVCIWDCDMEHSLDGVQIKGTKKRGGYVRDVHILNCTLPRFLVRAVLYNDDGIGAKHPPLFSDMTLTHVHFTGWSRNYWEPEFHELPVLDLSGFDEPGYEVRDVRLVGCTAGEHA